MRQLLFIAFSILMFPCFAEAKYLPLNLTDLLAKSELVVHGTISKLDKGSYTLTVTEVFFGDKNLKTIEVKRYQNWPCSSRWTEYKTGQKVFLCLAADKKNSEGKAKSYKIRSAGGEGEMPIVDGFAYVQSPSGVKLKASQLVHESVYGAKINATKVSLKSLKRYTRLLRTRRGGGRAAGK